MGQQESRIAPQKVLVDILAGRAVAVLAQDLLLKFDVLVREILVGFQKILLQLRVAVQLGDQVGEARAVVEFSAQPGQNVIRGEFNIEEKTLAAEIDKFIKLKDVPSYLCNSVDAIRNVGNFAAFDFTFVQPKRLEEMRLKLNEKLNAAGKPSMK